MVKYFHIQSTTKTLKLCGKIMKRTRLNTKTKKGYKNLKITNINYKRSNEYAYVKC